MTAHCPRRAEKTGEGLFAPDIKTQYKNKIPYCKADKYLL